MIMVYPDRCGTKERPGCILTDRSDDILINKDDLVVGWEDSFVFKRESKVIVGGKREIEATLDLTVLGTAVIVDSGDFPVADTSSPVKGATVINEGHIEVHTKYLLSKYKDLIQDPDHPDRPYKYLRLIVMNAGVNSQVINKGWIDVYFDHDESNTSTVYVIAMNGGIGSTLVNYGTISFHGKGSVNTRMRGMATFGDKVSCINYGKMKVDVDCLDDARLITTGGNRANVINDGVMELKGPGRVIGMTRYGDSNLINNGSISVTTKDYPAGTATNNEPTGCAMYEPLSETKQNIPPMINRGQIILKSESTEATSKERILLGMYVDIISGNASRLSPHVINEGTISIVQTGPVRICAAEAGFIPASWAKIPEDTVCAVSIGKWKTKIRDFAALHDLFIGDAVKVNYGAAELILIKDRTESDAGEVSIAPEDLFHKLGDTYTYATENYDALKVRAGNEKLAEAVRNTDKKTAMLKRKDES